MSDPANPNDRLILDQRQVAAAPVFDICAEAVGEAGPAGDRPQREGKFAQVAPLLPHAARRRPGRGGGDFALLDDRHADAARR